VCQLSVRFSISHFSFLIFHFNPGIASMILLTITIIVHVSVMRSHFSVKSLITRHLSRAFNEK
jgi:Na+/proline symporter